MVAQYTEARSDGEDECFQIGQIVVSGAPNVGGGEEGEDISGGLRELPELHKSYLAKYGREEKRTKRKPYAGPVGVIGGYLFRLRQAEDALLEAEFGVGSAHRNARHATCASCSGE